MTPRSKRLCGMIGGTALVGLLLFALTSCTSMEHYLEAREGQGCYRLDGYARGYLTVHGILATGGATMDQCIEAMWP